MNKYILYIFLGVLSCIRLDGQDDNPQSPELENLKEKFQDNVLDALKPAQQHYRDALKDLIQADLRSGNVKGALAAQQELQRTISGYPYTGTWKTKDGTSVIQFDSSGMYIQKWRGQIIKGRWKADLYSNCTVQDPDNPAGQNYFVLHFRLNDSGLILVRDMNNEEYEFVQPTEP